MRINQARYQSSPLFEADVDIYIHLSNIWRTLHEYDCNIFMRKNLKEVLIMTKKISKLVTVIAVVLIMAVSSMTTVVNAATINNASAPNRVPDYWELTIGSRDNIDFGVVRELTNLVDIGITFRCDSYYNAGYSGFYAYGQIIKPALRADYARGAILDHVGDEGTDSFKRGWFDINGGGDVDYYIQAFGYTLGVGQHMTGIAL